MTTRLRQPTPDDLMHFSLSALFCLDRCLNSYLAYLRYPYGYVFLHSYEKREKRKDAKGPPPARHSSMQYSTRMCADALHDWRRSDCPHVRDGPEHGVEIGWYLNNCIAHRSCCAEVDVEDGEVPGGVVVLGNSCISVAAPTFRQED